MSPGDFTVLTVPDVLEDRGDAWADIDAEVGDVAGALALWQRDVDERGLGELNFPPDYPKMPGEPPRVQPSKRRTDKADAEYMAPKAERDAAERERWGMPVVPPVPPMLAKAVKGIAALEGQDVSFEPKWDGFRSIVFRSGDLVEIGSRNEKPMTRYFPEVVEAALANLPDRCVVDGEIIVVRPGEDRLDFDLLSQRIHPAASRVKKLSVETPAQFVAFDLLALGDDDLTGRPFRERRALLEQALADAQAPIHLTAATTDRAVAAAVVHRVRGRRARRPGRQAARRHLRARQAHHGQDQARAHRRLRRRRLPHPQERRRPDRRAAARHPRRRRAAALGRASSGRSRWPGARSCSTSCSRWSTTFDDHPWAWARQEEGTRTPQNAAGSRWAAGKDLSFTPLRPERVVEVRYDHMEGVRFRHTAQFARWRPDRDPADCTFDQLDEPVSYDLSEVLSGGAG